MAIGTDSGETRRRGGKSVNAFRTISEVADELDVLPHVLRFWETKFDEVRPLKRGGGRRYYRPEDVALLRRIRELLYGDGYTIRGVQRLLKEGAVRLVPNGEAAPSERAAATGAAAGSDTAAEMEAPDMGAPDMGAKDAAPPDPVVASGPPPLVPDARAREEIRLVLDELLNLKRLLDDARGQQ